MSESNPPKCVKRTASRNRGAVPPTEVSETHVLDLPEELLHKILGGSTIGIERWTDLSLVCRAWQATMQSLVSLTLCLSLWILSVLSLVRGVGQRCDTQSYLDTHVRKRPRFFLVSISLMRAKEYKAVSIG